MGTGGKINRQFPRSLDKSRKPDIINCLSANQQEAKVYAIIVTGGKQYRVSPGDVLRVERLPGERGAEVVLDQVLMVNDDQELKVGQPLVANASVRGQILRQGQGKKILVYKKKRRKNYRRKQGHRQLYTALQIQEILFA
jgi:large subunit ribosomal protein L21